MTDLSAGTNVVRTAPCRKTTDAERVAAADLAEIRRRREEAMDAECDREGLAIIRSRQMRPSR